MNSYGSTHINESVRERAMGHITDETIQAMKEIAREKNATEVELKEGWLSLKWRENGIEYDATVFHAGDVRFKEVQVAIFDVMCARRTQ